MKYLLLILGFISFSSKSAIMYDELDFIEGSFVEAYGNSLFLNDLEWGAVNKFEPLSELRYNFVIDREKSIILEPLLVFIGDYGEPLKMFTVNPGQNDISGSIKDLDNVNLGGPEEFGYVITLRLWGSANSEVLDSSNKIVFKGGSIAASDMRSSLDVPETGTFALIMAGIVGLCKRRQVKANAALPV